MLLWALYISPVQSLWTECYLGGLTLLSHFLFPFSITNLLCFHISPFPKPLQVFFSDPTAVSPFFSYHLHQNFIFYLASGKALGHLRTGVSHWWWVVSLLVAPKPAMGGSCPPCRGTWPDSHCLEGLVPTTLLDGRICHLCLTPLPARGTERNTSMCLKLCAGNI